MARAKKKTKKPIVMHRSHSLKLQPHAHTSYPLLGMLVLITLFFCWSFTGGARGEDYQVKGRIPAPMLPTAATIDAPLANTTVESPQITVGGTCPDHSYVTLMNNSHLVGSMQCQPNGSWQISMTLRRGSNLLSVQAYNLTDDAGPTTPPITVTYQPPYTAPTPSNTSSQSASAPSAKPVNDNAPVIGFTFSFKAYAAHEMTDWPLTLAGGTPPYAIKVDWGDGAGNLQSLAAPGEFHLQHAYSKPATGRVGYPILITVADAAGQTTSLQLTVLVVPTGIAAANKPNAGQSSGWPQIQIDPQHFWQYAAPAYGMIVVALSTFWLGERYAMQQIAVQTVKAVKHRRGRR